MKALGVSSRVVRTGITALIVLDLLALVGFAVRRTTVTVRTTRPTASSTPAAGGSVPTTPPPSTSAPLSAAPPVSVAANGGSSTDPTSGGKGTSSAPPATPPTSVIPPVQVAALGKCPIKLAPPKEIGGLQSLVTFAPAFGPFSAEAFAAASAYAPELELLGPILAEYPKFAPSIEPLLTPLLDLFAAGTNSLFGAIGPLYTPHRTDVLSAETKLAAALAPYSEKLADTPIAGCVVDLEAALVGDTKTGNAKRASKAGSNKDAALERAVLKLIGRE